MPKKPPDLIYGVDEAPSLSTSLFLALQHVSVMSVVFIFPVVIVEAFGGSPDQAQTVIIASMLVMGAGTVLQALSRGPVGSGYLCPSINGPAYISASVMAAKSGGLSVLFGMTTMAGIFEVIISRMMHRLRYLFPAEVTGVVVALVGLTIVPLSINKFLALDRPPDERGAAIAIALLTLAGMVGFNIWGKKVLRLYCVLIGMGVGYLLSFALGIVPESDVNYLVNAPIFALPNLAHHPGWSFNLELAVPFFIASLSSSLKTVGDIVICQKINDIDWKRPHMGSISGGILADGINAILGGLSGALGQSTSSSNVGMSIATGATSRKIAFFIGGILTPVAFLPKIAAIFVIMPEPVMGAILVFVVSFMIVAGIQIIMSRMLDSRKTFVVGFALIFGLSVDIAPGLYSGLPASLNPLFSSSLSLGTILAVLLNLLFRLGIAKRNTLELEAGGEAGDKIFAFMEAQGGAWGARPEVIRSATSALNELNEAISGLGLADGPLTVEARFDEFNLDIDLRYQGRSMEIPGTRPTESEILEDEKGVARLAGFLASRYADRIRSEWKEGTSVVHLHFQH